VNRVSSVGENSFEEKRPIIRDELRNRESYSEPLKKKTFERKRKESCGFVGGGRSPGVTPPALTPMEKARSEKGC